MSSQTTSVTKTLEKRHGYAVRDQSHGTIERLCEWPETANRIADFPYQCVRPHDLWYDPEEGRYYGPIEVESPDQTDREFRRHYEAKAELEKQLRDAGFDVDEVRKTL